MSNTPILVIGATGTTGSRVASRLKNLRKPVRHRKRRATIPFDWENQSTWAAALEDASATYVRYFPDLACPGAVDKVKALCGVAKSGCSQSSGPALWMWRASCA